jgi:hypothetical protein
MTECAKCAEHQTRREQAERRAGEMEARYDRLTLAYAEAVRWRGMFAKYVAVVVQNEGVDFLHEGEWAAEEWAAVIALPGMEHLRKEGA